MRFYPEFVELNLELRGVLMPALMKINVEPENRYQQVIGFLAGKASKTHEAIVILAERGYGQDAGILTRSLLNLVINIHWIYQDGCKRAEKYYDYDWILRQQAEIEEEELRAQIDSKAEEVKRKHNYKPNFGWRDKSIADMAKDVGLEGTYRSAYKYLSRVEHSDVGSSKSYLTETPDGYGLNIGPDAKLVREVLASAYELLILVFDVADHAFKMGLEEKLAQARSNRPKFLGKDK